MVKKNQKRIPPSLQPWIDARRRFHLSHEHVQMARELGMNPKKLSGTLHGQLGAGGFWAMAALCLCAMPFIAQMAKAERG